MKQAIMAYDSHRIPNSSLFSHSLSSSRILISPRPLRDLTKLRYPDSGRSLEQGKDTGKTDAEKVIIRHSFRARRGEARSVVVETGRSLYPYRPPALPTQSILSPLSNSQSLPHLEPLSPRPLPSASSSLTRIAFKSQAGLVNHVEKPNNQDCCFSLESKGCHLLGVCDGHGVNGHLVSSYLKVFFPMYVFEGLTAYLSQGDDPAALSLKHGYIRCATGLNQSNIDCSNSGSTCVSVLIREGIITCGNVGDSRTVIGRRTARGWSAVALSTDHKPEIREELARIVHAGGEVCVSKVARAGPPRVYLRGANFPGLAMSRSLGDLFAHTIGVSSTPDFQTCVISKEDKFLILASDGIWEFISNIEAVRIVANHSETLDAAGACYHLISEAQIRWRCVDGFMDDITVIVAFLSA